jgi:hypothetical protein
MFDEAGGTLKGARFANLADVPDVDVEARRPMRVLMLADDRHVANVVVDHINAFSLHSRHEIVIRNPIHDPVPNCGWLSRFDAILIHYSIYVLGEYFLPGKWLATVVAFPGLKGQIIQDEHRQVNAMKARMAKIGVSVVFSSLESSTAAGVYCGDLLHNVCIFSCLPGYIADNFQKFSPPDIAARPLDICYRGRELPPFLGRHAQEKTKIGEQVLVAALRYGLNVDISSKEDSRIYGSGWQKFLMTSRATLGVEGGASIFDFDGTITASVNQYQSENSNATFEEIWERLLKPYEGNVVHKTLTPKLLEAIATKTALILYPGNYRGILAPRRHYIELSRDGSNIDEVIKFIGDTKYLQDLVDRTHSEIMAREDLSMRFYVRKIDAVFESFYYQPRFRQRHTLQMKTWLSCMRNRLNFRSNK